MKINNNFYKVLGTVLFVSLAISSYFFYKYSESLTDPGHGVDVTPGMIKESNALNSTTDCVGAKCTNRQVKNDSIQDGKVVSVREKHRLYVCAEGSVLESETQFDTSSPEVNGYRVLLDCDYVINTDHPDQKDEYFYILDIRNKTKYYINDNIKYVISTPSIMGVKGSNIFLKHCYEGCGRLEMFDLSKYGIPDGSNKNIHPYDIGQILTRNKIYSNGLFVLNNKVIIIYENKIYEFDESNFTLKVIKEISSDKVFGRYGGMGGEFSAEYTTEGNFIKYKIYKKDEVINDKDGKPVETGSLEIK